MENKKQEVVDRLVNEKGLSALDGLMDLVKDSEDPEVLSIVREALIRLGSAVKPRLLEFLEKATAESASLPGLLTAIETLGDIGTKGDIPTLYAHLKLFEHETDQLYVYEAIAKLGGGKELLSLLEFLLFEDEEKEWMRDHIIMILSHIDDRQALGFLGNVYALRDYDEEQEELILLSMMSLLSRRPEWIEELKASGEGRQIVERLSEKIKGQAEEDTTKRKEPE